MPDYRRYSVDGGTYFLTLVTAGRARLFRAARARQLLGRLMRETHEHSPFGTVAIVLLPDHLHAIGRFRPVTPITPFAGRPSRPDSRPSGSLSVARRRLSPKATSVSADAAYGSPVSSNTQFATSEICIIMRTTSTTTRSSTDTFSVQRIGPGLPFTAMCSVATIPRIGAIAATTAQLRQRRCRTVRVNLRCKS